MSRLAQLLDSRHGRLARAGYDIVPVPVYFPDTTEILGRAVYRTLEDITGPVDMVNVFRRSRDIPQHVPDILAARPKVVQDR